MFDEVSQQAEIWVWQGGGTQGRWHFLTLSGDAVDALRMRAMETRRGFGSVKVEATIGETSWRTSVFPQSGGKEFILPVKASVRRAEGIGAGDSVTVRLSF